jgi:hypothetical protein
MILIFSILVIAVAIYYPLSIVPITKRDSFLDTMTGIGELLFFCIATNSLLSLVIGTALLSSFPFSGPFATGFFAGIWKYLLYWISLGIASLIIGSRLERLASKEERSVAGPENGHSVGGFIYWRILIYRLAPFSLVFFIIITMVNFLPAGR